MKGKINWKVRLQNPMFYVQIVASFLLSILGYMGLTAPDITSWGILFNVVGDALMNPYCLMMALGGVYMSIVDTSSKGVSDDQATLEKKEL